MNEAKSVKSDENWKDLRAESQVNSGLGGGSNRGRVSSNQNCGLEPRAALHISAIANRRCTDQGNTWSAA